MLDLATRQCEEGAATIAEIGYRRRGPELAALQLCIAGQLPAARLGPDLAPDGTPSGIWLAKAATGSPAG